MFDKKTGQEMIEEIKAEQTEKRTNRIMVRNPHPCEPYNLMRRVYQRNGRPHVMIFKEWFEVGEVIVREFGAGEISRQFYVIKE